MRAERSRPTVLALGYCTLDVIRCGHQISHRAGGTAANVVANLAYLGWDAGFAGRLGQDAAGRRVRDDLRRSGVDIERVELHDSVETPVILHDVNPPRHDFLFRCPRCERAFPRHRPISDEQLTALLEDLEFVDVFFFDRASAAALRIATHLRERGSLIVFEPSAPGVPTRTLAAAETAHIVKCSHERRQRIDPRLLAVRRGQLQIETLGGDGVRYRLGSTRWKKLSAPAATVTDSGGAGDWLTAAFLAEGQPPSPERLDEVETQERLRQAQATAALSCRFIGARSLTALPVRVVTSAAAALLSGQMPPLPNIPMGRPSRAHVNCSLCLG